MKIRADRRALAEALSWVAQAVPRGPSLPVLAGIRDRPRQIERDAAQKLLVGSRRREGAGVRRFDRLVDEIAERTRGKRGRLPGQDGGDERGHAPQDAE